MWNLLSGVLGLDDGGKERRGFDGPEGGNAGNSRRIMDEIWALVGSFAAAATTVHFCTIYLWCRVFDNVLLSKRVRRMRDEEEDCVHPTARLRSIFLCFLPYKISQRSENRDPTLPTFL